MALGPLYCLTSIMGAMSDPILCTVDQDPSSLRSLWHLALRPTSSSTRLISCFSILYRTVFFQTVTCSSIVQEHLPVFWGGKTICTLLINTLCLEPSSKAQSNNLLLKSAGVPPSMLIKGWDYRSNRISKARPKKYPDTLDRRKGVNCAYTP